MAVLPVADRKKGAGYIMSIKIKSEAEKVVTLKTLLAAELFSKLPEVDQDRIISQIKALLSHE